MSRGRKSRVECREPGSAALRQTAFQARPSTFGSRPPSGFTLIEIMVVVAIIGVIAVAGIPTLYKLFHKEGLRQAVAEMTEICQNARARAILQQGTVTVVIHPRDGSAQVEGKGDTAPGTVTETHFDRGVQIEALSAYADGYDYRNASEVRICFYKEGTCDDMTVVIGQNNVFRKITLETTTALVLPVDSDPSKWR